MGNRRYTVEQFRTALDDPQVRTLADLCRALGIVPRGANYEGLRFFGRRHDLEVDHVLACRSIGVKLTDVWEAVKDGAELHAVAERLGFATDGRSLRKLAGCLEDLGLDVEHDAPWKRRRSYSDEALLAGIQSASSYPELCGSLGLRPLTNTYRRLRERAAELGVAIPESWSRPGRRSDVLGWPISGGRRSLHPGEVAKAVAGASSLADAIRALGGEPTSGAYRRIKRMIREFGISTSHFTPRAPRGGISKRPLKDVLIDGSLPPSGLARRLVDERVFDRSCATCERRDWGAELIPLELDHINGDRFDNRIENLRLLCPNCHALTPTYRGRNTGRYRSASPTDGLS